jgi:hypothetical protein
MFAVFPVPYTLTTCLPSITYRRILLASKLRFTRSGIASRCRVQDPPASPGSSKIQIASEPPRLSGEQLFGGEVVQRAPQDLTESGAFRFLPQFSAEATIYFRQANKGGTRSQPRSGARMQPRAPALGKTRKKLQSPEGAKESYGLRAGAGPGGKISGSPGCT